MAKILILLRHSYALSGYEARVSSDAQRPLSPRGLEKAAQTASALKQQFKVDLILTSPLLRAVQTAEILAAGLNTSIVKESILNGMADDRDVCEFLTAQFDTDKTILAVGHNPCVAYVTHLLCGQVRPFSPCSYAVIDMQDEMHPKLINFGE